MLAAMLRKQSTGESCLPDDLAGHGLSPQDAKKLCDEVVRQLLDALWLMTWDSRRHDQDFDPITALLERIDVDGIAERVNLPESQVMDTVCAIALDLAGARTNSTDWLQT